MTQIAILGFGTVGGGVAELIDLNRKAIESRLGEGLYVKRILDLRDFPGSPYADRITHDFEDILSDPEISIICETMGGKEPAYTFSRKALERGISVCTSNKELVAAHGPELLEIARKNGCNYLFEASVGGGIPIIRPMNTSMAPEDITSIMGILNGTTNYIMTRMEHAGIGFEEALKEAQEKGYAERNPEADVEGHDACRKIAILSSLMCGRTVRYEDVPCEGISSVTVNDFRYARAMQMAIKLLGTSKRDSEGNFFVRTAPYLVPASNPLHSVEDVFNAVYVHGNTVDDLMFYGRGAGKFPTASAVVSDVIDCARNPGHTLACKWEPEIMKLSDPAEEVFRYFVRLDKAEEKKAAAAYAGAMMLEAPEGVTGECALLTGPMTEKAFSEASAGLQVLSFIRMLG
ncbi:MAG: homoserine dehydrogenase [Lachnospiraceae bacterium]|nr:homoserine dehydrogenase [Lachnospiraceae bacterium]